MHLVGGPISPTQNTQRACPRLCSIAIYMYFVSYCLCFKFQKGMGMLAQPVVKALPSTIIGVSRFDVTKKYSEVVKFFGYDHDTLCYGNVNSEVFQ